MAVITVGTSTLSETWRIGYAQSKLALGLRTMMVSDKCFDLDTSNSFYFGKPYLTAATAAIAAMAGSYTVSTPVTTDDTLTVTDQVTYAVHLREFEETLARVDLYGSFIDDLTAAVATKADQFVLNKILDGATGTYNTPSGGFAAANINQIIAELTASVSGYQGVSQGMFLVIENTELAGFIQAGMTNGFNFADATINNGFRGNYGDVDIYVVRAGTYVTTTLGTLTATNLGHRLFGIKKQATYAMPGGTHYDEKKVTTLTGREISCWINVGAKVWAQTASLLVDVTIVS